MGRGLFLSFLVAAACGPSQPCRDYVACQIAYDESVDVSAYQEGGVCWGGTRQTAEACTAQCAAARDALSRVPNPPPTCAAP